MPETRPKLLFVCIENSNRSQMAEGFARTLGKRRLSAFSAEATSSASAREQRHG